HWHIGNLLADQGRLEDANERYRKALFLDPTFAEAELSLCLVLRQQGRLAEAIADMQALVERRPQFAKGHLALGTLLADQSRLDDASAALTRALALDPSLAATHFALGNILRARGDAASAMRCYRDAARLDPENAPARWALAVTHLEPVYDSEKSRTEGRRAFADALGELDRWIGERRLAAAFAIVGAPPPFYLAYHDEANRDLLQRHGRMCARIMAGRQPAPTGRRDDPGRPIRVAVVSAHLYNHSVWNALMKGWFQRHDAARFDLEAFHLGAEHDRETQTARSLASHFEAGDGNFERVSAAIALRQPDVIFYPEIGMDSLTYKLASLRLAPVQMTTWGHPETSGLPTVDYFVSAESLEPENAAAHYSEKLVLLPHLGCSYPARQLPFAPPEFGGGGPAASIPLLVCPGTPFKYEPRHDGILLEIARRLGRCHFLFFTYRVPEISRRLEHRLRARFAADGLDAEAFLRFLPWQTPAQFRGLMSGATLFLDTLGFSGFNTAMEAVK
ncbi:MAG: tetratricopeptide repeat protein, partial [Burkholderiales bacterium]